VKPKAKAISLGKLALGWKVTPTLAPKYWLDPDAKPGAQDKDDLVWVPGDALGSHTAIVAQSGSGKSFFLGRLIEELLLATKARCVVLDPNADFRRMSDIVDPSFWTNAKYDHKNSRGFLPHESKRANFEILWSKVRFRLLGGPQLWNEPSQQFRLSWQSLSVEFLAEDLDPMVRSAVYHCHQFVRAIVRLYRFQRFINRRGHAGGRDHPRSAGGGFDLIEGAKRILRQINHGPIDDRRNILEREFKIDSSNERGKVDELTSDRDQLLWNYSRAIDRAVGVVDYISEDASRYYFGKAQEFIAQGIVETNLDDIQAPKTTDARVEVIDLPSFPDWKTRLLALNSSLATEWERARRHWEEAVRRLGNDDTRVPTFIVVDEAHNVIPAVPQGLAAETLREQFRTIAAEGRKYGLFLIMCTQRPDKIDPLVLSECENQAIMKLGSRSVLEITKKLFGLDNVPTALLGKCLEFDTGRALLMGRWAQNGPELLYTAMRRTVEGGRNLQPKHWATPQFSASEDISEMSPSKHARKKGKIRFKASVERA
jgi:hypothetical protein